MHAKNESKLKYRSLNFSIDLIFACSSPKSISYLRTSEGDSNCVSKNLSVFDKLFYRWMPDKYCSFFVFGTPANKIKKYRMNLRLF